VLADIGVAPWRAISRRSDAEDFPARAERLYRAAPILHLDLEDPCDQTGGQDNSKILSWTSTKLGRRLERRFGLKRWLHWRAPDVVFLRPPSVAFVDRPSRISCATTAELVVSATTPGSARNT
jgi:hypothetical protein